MGEGIQVITLDQGRCYQITGGQGDLMSWEEA